MEPDYIPEDRIDSIEDLKSEKIMDRVDGKIIGIGPLARQACGRSVEFTDAVLGSVQLQAMACTTEAVGQDDVRARIDEAPVVRAHVVRLIDVPQLRRLARLQAKFEQVGPGPAVGEEHRFLGEQSLQRPGHRIGSPGLV